MTFGKRYLTPERVTGMRVIELGSRDVNGSLREHIFSLKPTDYLGIDFRGGKNVDIVRDMSHSTMLEDYAGAFDLVVSTEVLEHVADWRKAITVMKGICAPKGIILITTRSFGYPYHAHPYDHWRYEVEDMKRIFSDFERIRVQGDPESNGVFIVVKKPKPYVPNNIDDVWLYSMHHARKILKSPA
jgi:SAM-dependent methyltransferase